MRIFIVCLFALFAVGTATAETMCVKLDAGKSCRFEYPGNYVSNWTITCDGVAVSGVAYCSNQSADNTYDKSESVTISGTAEENIYCWSKMVSPAVSSWVFRRVYDSADRCAKSCADYCASSASANSDFQSALFSDLQ